MFSQYLEEFEVEEISVEQFIERLSWRAINDLEIDFLQETDLLCQSFGQTIADLKILQERSQRKCGQLEEALKEEKHAHRQQLDTLQDRQTSVVDAFRSLDEKINLVAGKIIHLGEQLENVNVPRRRICEAQNLLSHTIDLLAPAGSMGIMSMDLFNDKTRLFEAADVVLKLYVIAQELPAERFANVKKNIETLYDDVERRLIEKFAIDQQAGDIAEMKRVAGVLSQFKGFNQCVDVYIEQSQDSPHHGKDIFEGILPLCQRNYEIIGKVFSNPDQVMAKFILNIYQLKLNQYAQSRLDDRRDERKFLKNLYEIYVRTLKLSSDLAKSKLNIEDDLLPRLTSNIFAKYLTDYIEMEMRHLDAMFKRELTRFYESKNHNKRQIERFGELKRDVQALISTKTNITISQVDDFGGETFLSEELAVTMLQEYSAAFERCRLFSKEADFPGNVISMTDILFHYLLHDHCSYALDIGLSSIPLAESRAPPVIHFFDVVHKCNTIVHLLESTFSEKILPHISATSALLECTNKKRNLLETINNKINNGLDRALNVLVGWIRFHLQNEQKKSDFKPETDNFDTVASPACLAVVQQIDAGVDTLKRCVDGENQSVVLTEFGLRLHRVIFDHLAAFQYNTVGAVCAICDINEYKKSVRAIGSPLVTQLFDILHALCNLLLVKPENLLEVCCGDALNCLEKSVVLNFIQLRSDYRTIRLSNTLKGI